MLILTKDPRNISFALVALFESKKSYFTAIQIGLPIRLNFVSENSTNARDTGGGGFAVGAIGAVGGIVVPVGAGAVGDGGNGILPPSDRNKRFQNLTSSCDKFSCFNVALLAETKARLPNAIPMCEKTLIVVYTLS